MQPAAECGSCLTHWIYHRASAGLPDRGRVRLFELLVGTMADSCGRLPCLGQVSNRATDAAFGLSPALRGSYQDAKAASNRAAAELLPAASVYVAAGDSLQDRFVRACSLATLANVAPLGAPDGPFAFDELRALLEGGKGSPLVQGDPGSGVGARRIVYVLDNAGEVGFDSLVIRVLKEAGAHVTLVLKEPEFFEDATLEDVRFFGLDDLVDELVSVDGFLVPADARGAAAAALARCELVISKGTGSFESLYDELGETPGIFLLKVKCPAISRLLDVPRNTFVVAATECL